MKLLKITLPVLICFLLTGCWDKVELEERGLVLILGIDKYNSSQDDSIYNDEKPIYTISMDIPDVSSILNSSTSSNPTDDTDGEKASEKSSVKTATGQTIYSAMKLIDSYSSQRLYYGHTKAVIFGMELLENENYLKETIDALERNQEISRKLIVLTTKERAEDILKFMPSDQKDLGLFINDFYKNNIYNTSFTFRQDLESIIQDLLSTGDTIIPEIEIENNNIKISGLAIIKDYKLVGWLDENMSKSFLWFNKTKNVGGEISASFEEGFVPLKVTKNTIKITLEEEGDNIVSNININIEGNVGEYMLGQEVMVDTDKYKILQQEYEEKITQEVLSFLDVIQNEFKADILGLKELCRKNYNTIYKKFNLEENSIYDNILFNVNVDVKIKGSGNIK